MLIPTAFGETTALWALWSNNLLTSALGAMSPHAISHRTPDTASPQRQELFPSLSDVSLHLFVFYQVLP